MKFTVYKDFSGRWRWHLDTGTGERLATGEACGSRAECLQTIGLVRASFSAPEENGPAPPPCPPGFSRPDRDRMSYHSFAVRCRSRHRLPPP